MARGQLQGTVRHIHRLVGRQAMCGLTDLELLRRFTGARDQEAFAALVDRHGCLVLRLCRRLLHQEQDAEDCFQAAFVLLAQKAGTIRRQQSVGSWLYGVAHRVAMNAKRKAARRHRHESQAATQRSPGPGSQPSENASLREIQALLDDEVARLPEKYRAPFVLCCLDGKSGADAAHELGCKEGTLSGRLTRARQLLQRRLARRGVTLSAALCAAAVSAHAAPAKVPEVLTAATLEAALLTAAGQSAATVLPASAAALVKGVTNAMLLSRIKNALVLLAFLAAGVGVAMISHEVLAQRGETQDQRPRAAAAPAEPKPALAEKARVDSFGDPLPQGAIARLGTVRFRHGYYVYAANLSADGKTLISVGPTAGFQASIIAWDTATGKAKAEKKFFYVSASKLSPAAISHDGKLLALVPFYSVHLIDLETGKKIRELSHDKTEYIHAVALSADGKRLATSSEDGIVHLWDTTSFKELHRLRAHKKGYLSLTFSPDGKSLASGRSDGTIRLWDCATGKQQAQFAGYHAQFPDYHGYCLAFSPDAKMLAYSVGKKTFAIRLRDIAKQREACTLDVQKTQISCLCFSPDGTKLVSGDETGAITCWDLTTRKKGKTWKASNHAISRLITASSGKMLASASSDDNALRLWDLPSGKEMRPCAGHRGAASPISFSADGKELITTGRDRTCRQWDLRTGKDKVLLSRPMSPFEKVSSSPDHKFFIIANTRDFTVHLEDAATGKELCVLGKYSPSYSTDAFFHAFSPDSTILAGRGESGEIVLWDLVSRRVLRRLKGQDGLQCLAFSSDGKMLASGWENERRESMEHRKIRLWDVATGKELHHFDHPYAVNSLLFSPDGSLLACHGYWSTGERKRYGTSLWDVRTGKKFRQLPEGGQAPLAFSRDGRLLAVSTWEETTGRSGVWVYEVATGLVARRFDDGRNDLHGAAFAPDAKTMATGCTDSTIVIWPLTPRLAAEPRQAAALQQAWQTLARFDAAKAYDAVWCLALHPKSVAFLKERLKPAVPADPERLARLVAGLDSHRFAVRQTATSDLEKLGELAGPCLRKTLGRTSSVEVRQRLEALLAKLDQHILTAEQLQGVRAVAALEHIATPEARQLLKKLATGAPEARLTREARAALQRLAFSR